MIFKKPRVFPALAPLLAMLWTLSSAPAAFAHAHPISYDPALDATVSAPAAVTIHFTEALEPRFSSLSVADAHGHSANPAPSHVNATDAKVMTVALPHLAPGIYTVHWVSVALDGHRMVGNYKFTVKE